MAQPLPRQVPSSPANAPNPRPIRPNHLKIAHPKAEYHLNLLIAPNVPRRTLNYLEILALTNGGKALGSLTLAEAVRAVENVSRPNRDHTEKLPCTPKQPAPLPPAVFKEPKPPKSEPKTKTTSAAGRSLPPRLSPVSISVSTLIVQPLVKSSPDSVSVGTSSPPCAGFIAVSEVITFADANPCQPNAEPSTPKPERSCPPTESPAPFAFPEQQSSPLSRRPDERAFKDALAAEEVDEAWWHWARNKRQTWIADKRGRVWLRMRERGFSYAIIAAVSGGFDHTTIMHGVARIQAIIALEALAADVVSSHPEAMPPLDPPVPA